MQNYQTKNIAKNSFVQHFNQNIKGLVPTL